MSKVPLNDSVRNLISQFNSSGTHQPKELDQFEQAINESRRILTRAYLNLTGRQPTELPLPQITRPRTHRTEPTTEEQEQPVGTFPDLQIQQFLTGANQSSSSSRPPTSGGSGQPPSPPHSPPHIPQTPPSPPPTPRNMAGANPPNPNANMPWLAQDAVAVPGVQHPLPKHPEIFIPKFNLDRKEFVDDHIKKFMLVVRVMNVEHDDLACIFFTYTFEMKVQHGTSP